jgi:ABC-type transport system substrate-binding protein
MKKLNRWWALSLTLLIAGTAAAGGRGDTGSAGPKDTMVAGLSNISTAIDPMLANLSNVSSMGKHIYNTLVAYDDDNRVVGQIATAWNRPDNLTWEFTVDTASYKFHTGDPLTMEDVVFSLERCLSIPQAMDYVSGVASVRAEGNRLIIKTEAPNNGLLYKLTSVVITSKKAVEAAGDGWGQIAVGTGPYRLVSFIPSNEVVIERWDGHPSLKPALRRITFRAINDPTSRYIGIENGEFDFVDQVTGAGDIRRAQANSRLNAQIIKTLGMRFMAVNASKAPFDNPLVREALQYTIDRASIIALINGTDEPANTMISGALPAHSDMGIGQFDPPGPRNSLPRPGTPTGSAPPSGYTTIPGKPSPR